MCRTVETTAVASPENVPRLRRWVERVVSEAVDDADVVADAVVVSAELISNAVRAGAARLTVGVTLHVDEFRVSVTDDAGGVPHSEPPAGSATTGRGLPIVDAMAARWGVEIDSTGGTKTVWAALTVHGPVSVVSCSRRR